MRPRGKAKRVPDGFQPLPGRAPTNDERDATAALLKTIADRLWRIEQALKAAGYEVPKIEDQHDFPDAL